jgi:glutamine---fructose-6-phosphate transaminase (isomerizing)
MCGIFGVISKVGFKASSRDLSNLISHSEQRGRDSSGFLLYDDQKSYEIHKADYRISRLYKTIYDREVKLIFGHSRLVTNGISDNQPVYDDDIIVFHNGIIVNADDIWSTISQDQTLLIDTEIIAGLAKHHLQEALPLEEIPQKILDKCEGVVACSIIFPKLGKMCLFTNNGSLYLGDLESSQVFASESYPLTELGCNNITQVFEPKFIDVPIFEKEIEVISSNQRNLDLIPSLSLNTSEENLLEYKHHDLKRCTKCVLPETMTYINFDPDGVCNYCRNYTPRNIPRPKEELFELVEKYRRKAGNDCIIPFSGGRDSCYGLHLVVKELKMKAVAYTYDWGMVTDLARRNISRMCAELRVENIIVADDIEKKRRNIKRNLTAWLKAPDLGMVSILTAGDKHFFNYVEMIKKQTGINLNLWGVNPLEVTHFKAGFLGIPPDFEEKLVYSSGALKQLRYQWLRFRAMMKSPGYFNSSLWDTLSGEYFRSFKKKSDYFHIFDYWRWDENLVEDVLDSYDWERAPDTNSTWRIGDGTAAFYNYVYYTIAGFTEHDTFRSNQIREGDLTRQEALEFILDENQPRYPNIKWYLDAIGMNFEDVIGTVNRTPKIFNSPR